MLFKKIFIVFLTSLVSITTFAQDNTCPTFVSSVLKSVGQSCAGLGRNEACYGYNQVDANFWEVRDDLIFRTPSDRVSLVDLKQIATAPLNIDQKLWGVAVLNVQANLPETLPGQAVTMLLMGDTQIQNAVTPNKKTTITPVTSVAQSKANLRSMPTTTSNIVGDVAAGDKLNIVGLNPKKDWYEILREDGSHAWIWSALVKAVDNPDSLPVTANDVTSRYGPMQAFYFSARTSALDCHEAPSVLVIQSPQHISVNLNIDGLEIHLGSTVIFTTTVLDNSTHVLIGTLVEGSFQATYQSFTSTMTQPGQTFAVTLNQQGQVDENSTLVDLNTNSGVTDMIHFGCENVMNNSLLPYQPKTCDFTPTYTTNVPVATGGLSDLKAGDACTLLTKQLTNLRGGPGTEYPWNGQLLANTRELPDGYADGVDGSRWFHLNSGLWVRSDLVEQAGNCDALPSAAVVAAPTPLPPSASMTTYEIGSECDALNQLQSGQTIVFQMGVGRWSTPAAKEAALRGHVAVITIDGVSLTVYYEGTTLHVGNGEPPGYGDRARASWKVVEGRHIVSSYWTVHNLVESCVFTVSP